MRRFLAVMILYLAAALHSRADTTTERPALEKGRSLFLKNCAHCHANDATGDEGPDLRNLKQSDAWLQNRIRNGRKGEMPAFQERFNDEEIGALLRFLRTLKQAGQRGRTCSVVASRFRSKQEFDSMEDVRLFCRARIPAQLENYFGANRFVEFLEIVLARGWSPATFTSPFLDD